MTEPAHQTTPKTPTTDTSSTLGTANETTPTTNFELPANAVAYGDPELHPNDYEPIEIDPVLDAPSIIELLSEMMDPRYFVQCPNYRNHHKLEYKAKELTLNIQKTAQVKGNYLLTLSKRFSNGRVDNWVSTVRTLNDIMREVINYTA